MVSCGALGEADDGAAALRTAVQIVATGCSARPQVGVGNVVGDGLVATVAHVVAGADSILAVMPVGKEVPAVVVAIDRDRDLAVLRVDTTAAPLELGAPDGGSDASYVVWREAKPVVQRVEIVRTTAINAPTIDGDRKVERRGMQLRASVRNGDSGSVLVSDGRAVGLVFARSTDDETRAWATDVVELAPLLDGLGADAAAVDVGECS